MSELVYDPEKVVVLVVDDHELIRKSISKILLKMGFVEIIQAMNGDEAMKILSTTAVDLVFCDLYMPKTDGFGVLSKTRSLERNYDIPFIVVTGEAGKDDIVRVVEMGAEDYLLKPFQAQELEKKTQAVLTKYFSPSPLIFHARKAERHLMENQLEEAEAEVAKALAIDEGSSRANHIYAMLKSEYGEKGEAIQILQNNIDKNPSYLSTYTTLADLYLQIDSKSEAINILRSEVELNPKNVTRQNKLAGLLVKEGDYHGAIEHCRQALIEESKNTRALFTMGVAYAESGNLDKGIYYFKRLRRASPQSSKSLEAIVKFCMKAKKPKLAEVALRDEKKSHPKRLDTYIVLARFYMVTEEKEKAIELLEQALTVNPEFPQALQFKGQLELSMKNLDHALESFKKLIDIAPTPPNFIKYAECLIEAGSFNLGIKVLNQCLSSEQYRPQILMMIAFATAKTKQYTKAFFLYSFINSRGMANANTISTAQNLKNTITKRRMRGPSKAS